MQLFKRILILTISLFLIACEDVIHVDLDTAPSKLVIDASIDWIKNTSGNEQKVILSTSTGYYNAEFPTVSDAIVFITNSTDMVFNFIEMSNPGEYVCVDFIPVIGETYTLTVILNGETYTAVETLIGTPEIEATISQNNDGGVTGDEMEIQFSFQDDGSQENYYMTGVKSNHVAYPEYNLESDERYQGNMMVQFYSHEDLRQGDVLNIKLYGISRRFYDYFRKILTAANAGNPFGSTPTAVRGNIINQTNSENFPYGYFRLSEVDVRDYTIQ